MSKADWIRILVFTLLWIIVIYLFALDARSVDARAAAAPIPVEQFDRRTHLWTARAMVAEAGWLSGKDHIAIAYVFSRRWKAMSRRWPELRYLDIVFRYAKGLGSGRRQHSSRQIWIRALSPELSEPIGWPANAASWRRHRRYWSDTLDRAALWSRGRLADPCRGRATHFGGDMDEPRDGMVEVDCGETKNTFYEVK